MRHHDIDNVNDNFQELAGQSVSSLCLSSVIRAVSLVKIKKLFNCNINLFVNIRLETRPIYHRSCSC